MSKRRHWFAKPAVQQFSERLQDPRLVTRALIAREIDELRDGEIAERKKTGCVLRTAKHAAAWAASYVEVEASDLEEAFFSDAKKFTFCVLRSEDNRRLKLVFRLSTDGVGGWTEYGIEIRRCGEFYACYE